MSDINAKVVEIVVERLNVGADTVTAESSFINDLGADSLDIVELVMEFEEAFDLTIPDEDSENIRTVGEAVSYIESKVGGGDDAGDGGGDDAGDGGGDDAGDGGGDDAGDDAGDGGGDDAGDGGGDDAGTAPPAPPADEESAG